MNGLNYAEGTAIDEWIGIYWYKFGGSRNSMKTVTMSVIPKNPCMYHLDFTKKTLKLGPFEFLEVVKFLWKNYQFSCNWTIIKKNAA